MNKKQQKIEVSIVIPVRNEAGNLAELHQRLTSTCKKLTKPFEIIYVENASTDNSIEILKSLSNAKIIVLRWQPFMRKAQSIAMDAGFKAAKGKYIVYIDADLQVEPEEIPKFIDKLEEGYDVVCGWRQHRAETEDLDIFQPMRFVLRKIYDVFRNKLINEGVHDPGSAIKAFRRETIEHLDLYGEMHRFIIAILHWQGYKIAEIPVAHHPRKHGKSNYNILKGLNGFADLLNVFIWRKYSDRPLHLFGVTGLIIFTIGISMFGVLLILRALKLISLAYSIWPIISVLIIITGLQFFLSGIIADSLSRMMHSERKSQGYSIREIIET